MKIGKFVGKEFLLLDNNDIAICIDKLQGTKLNYSSNCEIQRTYNQKIDNVKIKGTHNYWGTNFRKRDFKAIVRNIALYVTKQSGKIETDEILTYVDGSDGTIQYSVNVKVYGSLHYKYQRGYTDGEIYSFYDYDTDLSELLKRAKEYYNTLKM